MKFTTMMMGLVIVSVMLIAGISIQGEAYRAAGITNPESQKLNESAYHSLSEINESMREVSQHISEMEESQNTETTLFSLFQLIPGVMIKVPLAILSFMINTPSFLISSMEEVLPWMPGWVMTGAVALIGIFVGIKLYHSIRGTGEV